MDVNWTVRRCGSWEKKKELGIPSAVKTQLQFSLPTIFTKAVVSLIDKNKPQKFWLALCSRVYWSVRRSASPLIGRKEGTEFDSTWADILSRYLATSLKWELCDPTGKKLIEECDYFCMSPYDAVVSFKETVCQSLFRIRKSHCFALSWSFSWLTFISTTFCRSRKKISQWLGEIGFTLPYGSSFPR